MWQSGAAAVQGKQRASKPPPRQMEEKIFEGITIFDKKKIKRWRYAMKYFLANT